MAELLISSVSRGGIKSNSLTENFSGLHQIKIIPEYKDTPQSVTIDGFSLFPSNKIGLECINILDNLALGVRDVFDFNILTDVNRFESWITSITSGIVLMKSKGPNKTTQSINNFFKRIGNVGWENYWSDTNNTTNSRYAAIYDCKLKKIMSEIIYSDDGEVILESIFDTFKDIGTNGYGNALVYEQQEYIVHKPTNPEFVRYMNKDAATLAELFVYPGETIRICADLYRNDVAKENNENVRLYYIGYKGNASVTSGYITMRENNTSTWEFVTDEYLIPNTIDRMRIYATAWPVKTSYLGSFGSRSVSVYRKKPDVEKQGKGSVGQWGFITENSIETDGNIVGSFLEKNVTSFEYGNLEPISFPQFKYNDGKYITLPKIVLNKDFEYSTSVVYSNTDVNGTILGSGTEDTLFIGMTTNKHTSGMGHHLSFNGVSIFKKSLVSCNKEYLYKMVVSDKKVSLFVDNEHIGTQSITVDRLKELPNIIVGNLLDGYVISSEFNDTIDPNNSRYYEYSRSEKLDFIKGSSIGSGVQYFGNNIVPDGSSGWLYCGVGSLSVPYGMKSGSKIYVTIVKNNGATLSPGISMNVRYEAMVVDNTVGGVTSSKNLTYALLNNKNWITAGNMDQLVVDIDCITSPNIDGLKPDLDWVKNRRFTFNFNGSSNIDIPPVYTINKKGFITLKLILENSSKSKYIIDGRSSNTQELQGGWIFVSSSNNISTSPNYKILKLNGKSVPDGSTVNLQPNIPYSLVIEMGLNSAIRKIGSRYSGDESFLGKIWDIRIEGEEDTRIYNNILESRLNSFSNGILDSNSPGNIVYNQIDLREWRMSDPTNSPIEVVSNIQFKFVKDVSEGGMTFNLNLPTRGKFVIDYDIECPRQIHLKDVYGTSVGVGDVMKVLDKGRFKGKIVHNHTNTNYDAGLYICVPNARKGDVITVRSIVAEVSKTDGIGINVSSPSYSFVEFYEPQMLGNTMSAWVPNSTNHNYLEILPKWTPNENGYRARFTGQWFSSCEFLNGSDENNVIRFVITSTNVSYVIKNKGVVSVNVASTHTMPNAKPFDVVLEYKRPNLIITCNGVVVSNVTYNHIYGSFSDRLVKNSNNQTDVVELTETTNTRTNSRKYNLMKTGFVIPIENKIQNMLTFDKKMRSAKLPSGVNGWDGSLILNNGKLKDDYYIYDYKLSRIVDNSVGVIVEFENKETPFDEIEITLYTYNKVPLKVFASKGNGNYVIKSSPELIEWIKPSSTYKVISFNPIGNSGLKIIDPKWKVALF